jgi:chitinase
MKGKGNIRLAISIIAIAIVLGITVMGASDTYANDIWVSAYYGGWMQDCGYTGYMNADKIDYSAVTHIIHFAISPKHDGTIEFSANCILPENSASLVTYARAAGKKVLISIGGWQTESAFLSATSDANRQKFINNLINFMVSRGYDGIDFDWEPISPSSVTQVKTFITELRAALDAITPRPLLTAAVFYEPALFAQLQDKFDQMNIMTYDLSGEWLKATWHHTPTYDGGYWFPASGPAPSANGLVNYFIAAGVKPAKLGIGIGFYGYVWKGGSGTSTGGATAPGQKWTTAPTSTVYSYSDIMDKFHKTANYRYDSAAGAAYLSFDTAGSSEDMFITYDDENSILEKIKYVRTKAIGGAMIFQLGGGWRPNAPVPDNLLQAVKSAVIQTQPQQPSPVTVPSAPTLSSPVNGATGVAVSTTLAWSASAGATSYTLQVSKNTGFTEIVNHTDVTSTSFSISGLSNNTVYYWRVLAKNVGGNSGWSSIWSFTTVSANNTVIANFNGSSVANGVSLKWQTTSESNNKGFDIERKFSTSNTWVKMGYVAGAGTSSVIRDYSYTDTATRKNRTYNYRLKQINNDGSFAYSSVITVRR